MTARQRPVSEPAVKRTCSSLAWKLRAYLHRGAESRGNDEAQPADRGGLRAWLDARFDLRSGAVLASTVGAVVLPVFAMVSPSIVRPGLMPLVVAIWGFSAVSAVITAVVGQLNDVQFTALGGGGMFGIAGSAYAAVDNGASHAILVLLATIPALAAMRSRPALVVAFVATAVALATVVSVAVASSWASFAIAGGATVMAVTVPTAMVAALRRSLMKLVARLEIIGDTDPLTGVWNRRGLERRLHTVMNTAVDRRAGVGIAIVDIDYFKTVNDRLGHSAGDQVLIDVVTAVAAVAPDDGLVARVGGEEFLVMTPISNLFAIAEISEAIRARIARDTTVTASVGAVYAGIAHCDEPLRRANEFSNGDQTRRDLLDHLSRCADENLYTSKALGRNRVIFGTVPSVDWSTITPSRPPAQR